MADGIFHIWGVLTEFVIRLRQVHIKNTITINIIQRKEFLKQYLRKEMLSVTETNSILLLLIRSQYIFKRIKRNMKQCFCILKKKYFTKSNTSNFWKYCITCG